MHQGQLNCSKNFSLKFLAATHRVRDGRKQRANRNKVRARGLPSAVLPLQGRLVFRHRQVGLPRVHPQGRLPPAPRLARHELQVPRPPPTASLSTSVFLYKLISTRFVSQHFLLQYHELMKLPMNNFPFDRWNKFVWKIKWSEYANDLEDLGTDYGTINCL